MKNAHTSGASLRTNQEAPKFFSSQLLRAIQGSRSSEDLSDFINVFEFHGVIVRSEFFQKYSQYSRKCSAAHLNQVLSNFHV